VSRPCSSPGRWRPPRRRAARHRGSAHGVRGGIARSPRRRDRDAGREQVHAAPVVGERCLAVVRVGRAHRECRRDPGRRGGAGVHGQPEDVAVARRDRVRRAVRDRVRDGLVHRRRCRTTEAHVRDGSLAEIVILSDPVDAGDHAGGAARTATRLTSLATPYVETSDRPRDVGAVAVAVVGVPAVDRVESARRAAAELRCEDRIRCRSRTRSRRSRSPRTLGVERQRALIDPIEAPGGRRLRLDRRTTASCST
jgi:hypothetical protein